MTSDQSLLSALREAVRGPGWKAGRRPVEGRMPSLDGATGWLNSPPLTTAGLRGRVVAVDFWTYTCVNWLRTAPYLRAWDAAYRDAGLVVLGVHTPEFPFEREVDNVRRAVGDRRITYPVAVDSDYAVWTAFANMYWPALYLVDPQGDIRYHHFGEGAYEESEQVIRHLLGEAGAGDALPGPVTVEAHGIEAAADWTTLGTAETYLGRERPGEWAVSGRWTVEPDAVLLDEAGGRLTVRCTARDVNLVMAPPVGGGPVQLTVRVDGQPPGRDAGEDLADDGTGTLDQPRTYQLVRQAGPVRSRTVEITFSGPGVRAYAFTFG